MGSHLFFIYSELDAQTGIYRKYPNVSIGDFIKKKSGNSVGARGPTDLTACAQRHNGKVPSNQQPGSRGDDCITASRKNGDGNDSPLNVIVIYLEARVTSIDRVLFLITE